jgi:hypothetical protein
MEQRDPEDMTASELLRATADSIRDGVNCGGDRFTSGDSIDELREMLDVDPEPTYAEDMVSALPVLADKIDAELAQARELSLRQGAELWAKANDWPDFKEGENFGAWLDRCAFAKPLDDCGEPVQIGERVVDKVRGDIDVSRISYTAKGFYFNASHNANGSRIANRITYAADEPVERVRVLGADGRPISEGDELWDVYGGGPVIAKRIGPADGEDGPAVWDSEGNYTMPYLLTHERPVLGADGKPLKVGETVWNIFSGIEGIIKALNLNGESTAYVEWNDGRWSPGVLCDRLTHTPPDTRAAVVSLIGAHSAERIDKLVREGRWLDE